MSRLGTTPRPPRDRVTEIVAGTVLKRD